MKFVVLTAVVILLGNSLSAFGSDAIGKAETSDQSAAQLWSHLQDLRVIRHMANSKAEKIAACQDIVATSKTYVSRYPSDGHATEVRILAAHSAIDLVEMKAAAGISEVELDANLKKLATNPNLPKTTRAEARMMEVEVAADKAAMNSGEHAGDWARVDAMIASFEKEFGRDFVVDGDDAVDQLHIQELESLQQAHEEKRSHTLLHQLARSKDADLAAFANETLAQETLLAKLKQAPLDLKFQAVDGKTVDLAAMRGKVVLIDFWATWCPDCRLEASDVVALYQKYHGQGFEIVGISLDGDKSKMLSYTKQHGMTWPQNFDGLKWDNAISKSFDVHEIPTMWLIDQKGMLVATTTDSDEAAAQVQKLLKKS